MLIPNYYAAHIMDDINGPQPRDFTYSYMVNIRSKTRCLACVSIGIRSREVDRTHSFSFSCFGGAHRLNCQYFVTRIRFARRLCRRILLWFTSEVRGVQSWTPPTLCKHTDFELELHPAYLHHVCTLVKVNLEEFRMLQYSHLDHMGEYAKMIPEQDEL